MLILKPTTSNQLISIVPRTSNVDGVMSIRIRKDGGGQEEISSPFATLKEPNHIDVFMSSAILVEDATYYLEITMDGNLWYRDKIYVTSSTKDDIKQVKHTIKSSVNYKTYDKVDDNTYII